MDDFFIGYNTLALPKTGIFPLQLLSKQGDSLNNLNDSLKDFFNPDTKPIPAPKENSLMDMRANQKLSFKASAGLSLLKGLMSKFGLGEMSYNQQENSDYTVLLSFENIKESIIGLKDLDDCIWGAIPEMQKFRTYEDRLKKSELYVITSTLKSNDFLIKVVDNNQQQVNINLGIKDVAGAYAEIRQQEDHSVKLVHKGKEPLVFAFKAVQIIYDRPSFWAGLFSSNTQGKFRIKEQTRVVLQTPEDIPVLELRMNGDLVDI